MVWSMAYSVSEAKELVIRAGRELLASGLIVRTWGNISARVSDTHFVITPSGRDYESLTPDDIVEVAIADCTYEGEVKPSSECRVHAVGYRERPDAGFIIHTHQNMASCISILGEVHDVPEEHRSVLGDRIPAARYGRNGTERLAANVAEGLRTYPAARAVLMKNHGAICVGSDYDSAFKVARTLENIAGEIYKERLSVASGTADGEAAAKSTGALDEAVSADIILPVFELHEYYHEIAYVRTYRKTLGDESIGSIIHTMTPYVMRISELGKTMPAYIDDLAMIGGASIRCVGADATMPIIDAALDDRSAVLIRDNGALCIAPDREEAEALCMVLEKNACAAYLAHTLGGISPINGKAAAEDRKNYLESYSKLK